MALKTKAMKNQCIESVKLSRPESFKMNFPNLGLVPFQMIITNFQYKAEITKFELNCI